MNAETSHPTYQIRVRGHLDERWRRWFEDFELTLHPDGETVITGVVVDQAALYGALNRLRDLGLSLISIQQIAASSQDT